MAGRRFFARGLFYRALAPIICACVLAYLCARSIFGNAGFAEGSRQFWMSGWSGALVVSFLGLAVLTLWLRPHNPAALIVIEFTELLFAMFVDIGDDSLLRVLIFFCLYLCAWLPQYFQGSCDLLALLLLTAYCVKPGAQLNQYYPLAFVLMAALALVSSIYRLVAERRRAAEQVKKLERQSYLLAQQRDQARDLSRMAVELHDSVGHSLTVIIAFSQGLRDLLKRRDSLDQEASQAVDGIEQLARESLDNTRKMLDRLNGAGGQAGTATDMAREKDVVEPGPVEQNPVQSAAAQQDLRQQSLEQPPDRLYQWDDIRPIFERIRSLGISLVFTETGRRASDQDQANLCFRLTRECLTNALQHAPGLTRIAVSWDHQAEGTRVTVRNDGVFAEADSQPDSRTGTGLQMLSQAIQAQGGNLSTQVLAGQWEVHALIAQKEGKADAD